LSSIKEKIVVLESLKHGDCFCECGVGNPMMNGTHTEMCVAATKLLAEYKADLEEEKW